MRKKLLLWLFRKNPTEIADILIKDFLGVMTNNPVDKSAMDFLARNRTSFEPWLIRLAYTLQKENIIQRENLHKDEFYNGALFIIRLLYSLTNKDLPVQFETKPKSENIKSPQADVDAFLEGMKGKNNGQKDVQVSQGQGAEVQKQHAKNEDGQGAQSS